MTSLRDVGVGSSGTFTDAIGNTISWNSSHVYGTSIVNYGVTMAENRLPWQPHIINFNDGSGGGAVGLTISIGSLSTLAPPARSETVDVWVNGVDVNLNTMVSSGDATVIPRSDWPSVINQDDGSINAAGDLASDGSGLQDFMVVRFNIPVTNLRLIHSGTQWSTSDIYIDDDFVCFAAGTRIVTCGREVAVEDLSVGDAVFTMDNGFQTIRWIGSKRLGADALARNPKLRPIRIAAGALGEGLPEQDLTVSPQHRLLLRSKVAARMFGGHEVLVPAIKLVGLPGIEQLTGCTEVTYWHFLLDRHEVVLANGAPTESLFTGPEALKAVSPEARAEIEALFPEIAEAGYRPVPARPIPKTGKQVSQLVARHVKNDMALVDSRAG